MSDEISEERVGRIGKIRCVEVTYGRREDDCGLCVTCLARHALRLRARVEWLTAEVARLEALNGECHLCEGMGRVVDDSNETIARLRRERDEAREEIGIWSRTRAADVALHMKHKSRIAELEAILKAEENAMACLDMEKRAESAEARAAELERALRLWESVPCDEAPRVLGQCSACARDAALAAPAPEAEPALAELRRAVADAFAAWCYEGADLQLEAAMYRLRDMLFDSGTAPEAEPAEEHPDKARERREPWRDEFHFKGAEPAEDAEGGGGERCGRHLGAYTDPRCPHPDCAERSHP